MRGIAQSVTILALLIAGATGVRAAVAPLPENWTLSWDEAVAHAKSANKPILAVFSAEWCGPCQAMVREVYPKETVKQALKAWVPVYIDSDKFPDLAKKFNIEAFPTFVLLSAAAEEQKRVVGAMPDDKFISLLKTHLELTAKLIEVKAKLEKTPEDAPLWKTLGDIHDKMMNGQEALAAYEKAAFYDPKNETGVAAPLYFLKSIPKAPDELKDCSQKLAAFEGKFPKSDLLPKVYLFRSWIAADMDDAPGAAKLLKEGIKRFPDSEFTDKMKETLEQLQDRLDHDEPAKEEPKN